MARAANSLTANARSADGDVDTLGIKNRLDRHCSPFAQDATDAPRLIVMESSSTSRINSRFAVHNAGSMNEVASWRTDFPILGA